MVCFARLRFERSEGAAKGECGKGRRSLCCVSNVSPPRPSHSAMCARNMRLMQQRRMRSISGQSQAKTGGGWRAERSPQEAQLSAALSRSSRGCALLPLHSPLPATYTLARRDAQHGKDGWKGAVNCSPTRQRERSKAEAKKSLKVERCTRKTNAAPEKIKRFNYNAVPCIATTGESLFTQGKLISVNIDRRRMS